MLRQPMTELADPPVAPPQPLKCRTTLLRDHDRLTLARRPGGIGIAAGLLIWLSIWTVGCVAMFFKLIREFEWQFLLFATPFYFAEIGVLLVVAWMLFGRQRLTLDRSGATLTWSLFGLTRLRHAKLSDVRDVEEYTWGTSNDKPMYGIRINTSGKPLTFAFQASDDERRWLMHVLKEQIATLSAATTTASHFSAPLLSPAPRGDGEATGRWQIEDNIRTVTLRIRNESSLSQVAIATGIMLFWNGVVAVFVAGLFQHFDWFHCLFLIPFEIVGLIMVGVWLMALLAPLTTTTWTLDGNELKRRVRIALFGWTRRWPTHTATRAERAVDPRARRSDSIHAGTGRCWRVQLIDAANNEIAVVRPLNESQAAAFHDAITRRLVKGQ